MVVTDLSIQDIVALANSMRGMDTDNICTANRPRAGEDTYIDGVSYVFVYEDELAEMMERVNNGENPKGPQTMGQGGEDYATTGDLMSNASSDWSNGTATIASSEAESEETESE